jgi:chorismate synthase
MFFKFTTAGESHGKALVAIVEGLPAGLEIDVEKINFELWRGSRATGAAGGNENRKRRNRILSGVRHGKTLGSPVALLIENKDFVHWQEVMSAEKLEIEPKNPRLVKRVRDRDTPIWRAVRNSNQRFARHSGTRFGARNGGARRLRRNRQTTAGKFRRRNKKPRHQTRQSVPEVPLEKTGTK